MKRASFIVGRPGSVVAQEIHASTAVTAAFKWVALNDAMARELGTFELEVEHNGTTRTLSIRPSGDGFEVST